MSSNCDVAVVDTDDLSAELVNRFDYAVFAGYRDLSPNGSFTLRRTWNGRSIACVGLCNLLSDAISEGLVKDAQEGDG